MLHAMIRSSRAWACLPQPSFAKDAPVTGVPAVAQVAMPGDHGCSISLPFLDTSGSVQAARSKQQGSRFPLFIFDILTSTRRLRVSGSLVAFTQRTHSQRAMGVMSYQRSWISRGAAARAARN